MKKTFLAKRNALFSSANFSWGIVALICALLVLFVRLFAPNFFWQVFTPVFHSADALAAQGHSFLNSFGDTAALALKNEQLTNENAALASENEALARRVADISALSGSQAAEGIIAGVVARPPESPYDTLVIAAGSDAGVVIGQEVFGAGGVPLGVISSVLADFSRATLFSAPGVATSGWVGDASVPITIFGAGAGALNASVARSANIAIGDMVFVPGPGRLPLGSVARVESDPSSPSATLRIQPALNPFSVTWVLVRTTGAPLLLSATSTFL